jgi:hemerythrin-like domain-containing protein
MGATDAFEAIRAFGEHEHLEVAHGLALINQAACDVRTMQPFATARAIRAVLAWSRDTLEPHIAWEESWLYPQIDRLTGTPWATRSARFDHRQIRALAACLKQDELATTHSIGPAAVDEARARLFAFEALLRSHIDREEQLLLPVLSEAPARTGEVAGAGLDG